MRIIRLAAIVLVALSLSGCHAIGLGLAARADHARKPRDAVSQTLLGWPWKDQRPLSPAPLSLGQTRAMIEGQLSAAGYQRRVDLTGGFDGAEVWHRGVEGIPCNTSLTVFLAFDAANRLVRAEGVHTEAGCL